MKKTLVLLAFIITCPIISQNTVYQSGDTVYYSLNDRIVNKEQARRLAIIRQKNNIKNSFVYTADYYKLDTITNEFYKTETFNTQYLELLRRQGKNTLFWKSGEKKSEGLLKKGRRIGVWTMWYENGIKQEQRRYFEQKKLLKGDKAKTSELISFWNRKGEQTVKDGTGDYFFEYENGVEIKGRWADSKKDGEWISFRKDGSVIYKERYKNGKLKKGESWDEDGKRYTYKASFVNPKYSGGQEGLANMIRKNFKVPEYAVANEIKGVMIVDFKVNTKGEVEDIVVRKKLCEPCDQEAIRLVSLLKKWKPAKMRGKEVRVKYTLPLRIDF